jgi:hypothetical protein
MPAAEHRSIGRRGRSGQLAHLLGAEQRDASERVQCLRLQAMAWRQMAMIALHDVDYARSRAGWLLMMSVPFVNGPALEKFVEEHADMAERCGIAAGILSASR